MLNRYWLTLHTQKAMVNRYWLTLHTVLNRYWLILYRQSHVKIGTGTVTHKYDRS